MEKLPMTRAGFEKMQAELKELKSVERPAIIKAIATAREMGDLSENAEYHSARERQGFIEGRIAELENKVSLALVIDISSLSGKTVKFGATIQLYDDDAEKEVKYQIVGDDESNHNAGLISVSSPLSRALIGREVGDVVDVNTPSGVKSYEIVKVSFI